jgi:cobalt-zinc-cadmium efflux system protein
MSSGTHLGHGPDGHGHDAHAHGPDQAHGHDHAHRHAHGHGGHAAGSSFRRLGLSLGLTSTIMVAETIGGLWSGSLALLSDAGHMLTDAGALALAMVAAWVATRKPDERRTFGFRRAEVLAAQLNVGGLVLLTGWLSWEAISRLREGSPPIDLGLMSVVAAVGLAANLAILGVLRHDHGLNARSAFLHVVADTVSSVAILIGAGVMWLRPAWTWLDPLLSLVIAGLILWGTVGLIREITGVLMEGVPRHLSLAEVQATMAAASPDVVAIHDLHLWTISSGLYALSAHVVIAPEALGRNDQILTDVKRLLCDRYQVDHTTLQIESADYEHLHAVCPQDH